MIGKRLIIFYLFHIRIYCKITIENVCDDMSANAAELISATTMVFYFSTCRHTKSFLFSPSFCIGIRFRCVYTINYDYYIILCPCNSILPKLVLWTIINSIFKTISYMGTGPEILNWSVLYFSYRVKGYKSWKFNQSISKTTNKIMLTNL